MVQEETPRIATPEHTGAEFAVHLLDVGPDEYGDAVLCRFGDVSVLIDGAHPGDYRGKGGHPSIPQQLKELLGQEQSPYRVSLLVVTHAHQDHIGCLPYLVENDLLRADWALVADPGFGWGTPVQDDGAPDRSEGDPLSARPVPERVAAALREEVRTEATDNDAMAEFMDAAINLQSRYTGMLDTLRERGTRVVRYGRDDSAPLLREFLSVGFKILGPTQRQLVICTTKIEEASQDAMDILSGAPFEQDAPLDLVALYRSLVGGAAGEAEAGLDAPDTLDAARRPGPAINLQSIVARFEYAGHKFLFTGDMQFAKHELTGLTPDNSRALAQELGKLRQAIKNDGPYVFAKIAHHGSYNAFDERLLQELGGARFLGICAGERSLSHPNRDVLRLLSQHEGSLQWARTDRNGRTTLTRDEEGRLVFRTSTGDINDPTPNTRDSIPSVSSEGPASPTSTALPATRTSSTAPGAPSQAAPGPPAPTYEHGTLGRPAAREEAGASSTDHVEVITRVPHVATRVTVTIDVAPASSTLADPSAPRPPAHAQGILPASLNIAGGRRTLPELLFVTSRQALAANIGTAETDFVLEALRDFGMPLYDAVPPGLQRTSGVMDLVRPELSRNPAIEGVVVLGGYDVIPAQLLDTLTPALRRRLSTSALGADPDAFIVWSDDVYGDRDGDGLPELPVSRIPDGKSAEVLFAAIQASDDGPVRGTRSGIRNVHRPFADRIYQGLPGAGAMLNSEPTASGRYPPSFDLAADRVYLMLHGSHEDGRRFWGESDFGGALEAVNVGDVPPSGGRVVFTGCCWGALVVETPAVFAGPGRSVAQKSPETSLALSFLASGVTAFVGCTGAHYSPMVSPYQYAGEPLHAAFWNRYNAGAAPARALFEAKTDYVEVMGHGSGIPRGASRRRTLSIEKKILRQFTCLGLGW